MSELTTIKTKSKSTKKIISKHEPQSSINSHHFLQRKEFSNTIKQNIQNRFNKNKIDKNTELNSKSYRTLNILKDEKIHKSKIRSLRNTKNNFYKKNINKSISNKSIKEIKLKKNIFSTNKKSGLKIKSPDLDNSSLKIKNKLYSSNKFFENKSNLTLNSNNNNKLSNNDRNNIDEQNKKELTLCLSVEKNDALLNGITLFEPSAPKKSESIFVQKSDIENKSENENENINVRKNLFDDSKNKTVETNKTVYIYKKMNNNNITKPKIIKNKTKLKKLKINKLINNKNRTTFSPKINRDLLNIKQNIILNHSLQNRIANNLSLKNKSKDGKFNETKNLTIRIVNKKEKKPVNFKYILKKNINNNKINSKNINEIKTAEKPIDLITPKKVLKMHKNSSRNKNINHKINDLKLIHDNKLDDSSNNKGNQKRHLNNAKSQTDIETDYLIKKLEKDSNDISKNQETSTKEIKSNEIEEKKIVRLDSICKKGFAGPGVKKICQDNYFIFNNLVENKDYRFMGICDGHGANGQEVSGYLSLYLPQNLNERLISEKITNLSDVNLSKISDAISSIFIETNMDLISDESIDTLFSGSTCCSIIYTPKKIISINVGDSRCVVGKFDGKNWKAKNLSRDHKPSEEDEYERIIKTGGRVESYKNDDGDPVGPERVWLKDEDFPGLAMSRSFGDEIAHSAGVIAEPEISEYYFVHEDKFVIIASDGIFEFISSDECVSMLKNFYLKDDIDGAMYYLYKESSKKWIMEEEVIDDISMILIFLN